MLAAVITGLIQGLPGFLPISYSGHRVLVTAVSGHLAITFLLSALRRTGLIPFATDCFVVGGLRVALLG